MWSASSCADVAAIRRGHQEHRGLRAHAAENADAARRAHVAPAVVWAGNAATMISPMWVAVLNAEGQRQAHVEKAGQHRGRSAAGSEVLRTASSDAPR